MLYYAIGLTHLTRCAKIQLGMKFNIFKKAEITNKVKTISDYRQDLLVKQGREQFKKLLEKGINVPVGLL